MASDLPFQLDDPTLGQPDCFIHGELIAAADSEKRFDIRDPATDKVWRSCPDCRAADVPAAVESAQKAFKVYSKWTARQRATCLLKWRELIGEAKADLGKILVYETGKTLAMAYREIHHAMECQWWFAGEAERIQGTTISPSGAPGHKGFTIKQPIGVTAALVAWNYPLQLAVKKASAALAAGCTVVMKPSPESPLSAIAVAQLALRAGFPPGALNVLTASEEGTPSLAEALCSHPVVRLVNFTGSVRVGRILSEICGRNLKETIMELGGNCPVMVFDDASVASAAAQLSMLKWCHAGQTCVNPDRVYVQRGVHDQLVSQCVQHAARIRIGHGMDKDTTMGPVVVRRTLDRVEALVEDALKKGAKLAHGTGKRVTETEGYFMQPTILTGVTDDMLLNQEEIFGPLIGISVFDSEDEVVERANATATGLSSYVFSGDGDRQWRLFERLEAGTIGLNTVMVSPVELPFGAMKDSGHGKESGKEVALERFLVAKSAAYFIQGL